MKLQKNMMPVERWLRIYFGAMIAAVLLWYPWPFWEWTLSGYLLIATGIFGYCPI